MPLGLIRRAPLILCLLVQGCAPPREWSPPPTASASRSASQHAAQTLPVFSQAEVLALLESDQYATLDQHFSALQQQYADGVIADTALRDSFRVFYPTERVLAARYDGWVAQFPKSYA